MPCRISTDSRLFRWASYLELCPASCVFSARSDIFSNCTRRQNFKWLEKGDIFICKTILPSVGTERHYLLLLDVSITVLKPKFSRPGSGVLVPLIPRTK